MSMFAYNSQFLRRAIVRQSQSCPLRKKNDIAHIGDDDDGEC